MGKLSLLLVLGAFLATAMMVFRASGATLDSEEQVWEHQYHVIARDAASTGINDVPPINGASCSQFTAAQKTCLSQLVL